MTRISIFHGHGRITQFSTAYWGDVCVLLTWLPDIESVMVGTERCHTEDHTRLTPYVHILRCQ